MAKFPEVLRHARERLTTPTDLQLVQRIQEDGINTVVTVPCSITQTIDPIWNAKSRAGEMNYWKMVNEHSLDSVFARERVSRTEAIRGIIQNHETSAIIFSNGFTAREAQDKNDRLGNFYNAGYMGGGLAIGWGLAKSNPNIDVIVVDGDQNAEMGKMTEVLANDYPDNLHWTILDNGFGVSVGVSESQALPWWYYDLAQVIRTVPDQPGEFKSPRVGGRGAYFDMDEIKLLADRVGPLPIQAERFRHWVDLTSRGNLHLQTLLQARGWDFTI